MENYTENIMKYLQQKHDTKKTSSDIQATRFLDKVLKLPSGCWLWMGALQGKYAKEVNGGYGSFRYNKKVTPAHIASCHIHGKEIPSGKHIDHLCRITSCVNPDHLEPVSARTNWERGINNKGEFHMAKTHCPNGHEYTAKNTRTTKDYKGKGKTFRECIICRKAKFKRHDAKRRPRKCS